MHDAVVRNTGRAFTVATQLLFCVFLRLLDQIVDCVKRHRHINECCWNNHSLLS